MSTYSKVIAQTDTHRHDKNITSTTYAGGNKFRGNRFRVKQLS